MPKVSIVSKKILLNPNQQNENRLKIHKETMSILDRIFKGYSMHLISLLLKFSAEKQRGQIRYL